MAVTAESVASTSGGPSPALTTTAVSRSLSDLHVPTWLALMATSAFVRTALTHPLNLAVTRKRVSPEKRPPTLVQLLRSTFASDGLRGCYRGLGVAACGNVLGETSYLWTLEYVREQLSVSSGGLSRDALGGMCGDFVALALVAPLNVVCNRQMTAGFGLAHANTYRSAPATVRDVWMVYQQPQQSHSRRHVVANGFRGLYAGAGASLAALPASGVWWASYGAVKAALYRGVGFVLPLPPTANACDNPLLTPAQRHLCVADAPIERSLATAGIGRGESEERAAAASIAAALLTTEWFFSRTDNPIVNGTAGMLASVLTTTIFNPIAVVRTRLQTLPPTEQGGRGFWHSRTCVICRELVRREGWRAFFKGTSANVAVSVLDGLAFSLLYELTKLGSDRGLLSGGTQQ